MMEKVNGEAREATLSMNWVFPFSQAGGTRLFHMINRCYEVTSLPITSKEQGRRAKV